jgi:hypothetical protein
LKDVYGKRVTFIPFKGGEKAQQIVHVPELDIYNKISEAWLRAHLLIDRNKGGILVANLDMTTRHQLTNRRSDLAPRGKQPQVWFIEAKDDYKKRERGRSPDHADAFVMAVMALTEPERRWVGK